MVKTTVLKIDLSCPKRKRKLLKSVCRLQGVDSVDSTFTVTGNADPYEVVVRTRKSIKVAEVVSIGSPPEPDAGGGEEKTDDDGKKQEQQEEKENNEMMTSNTYPQHQPCLMCVREVLTDHDHVPLCSIL